VEIASCAIVALQKLRCYNGIMTTHRVHSLTDEQLLDHLQQAATAERSATARLIALLAEMDERRLYLAQGYPSLFMYCTRSLRLSEHAAYGRIETARAMRKWPVILELLTDGSMTLTTICLLAGHLTTENYREVLDQARHKSKRDVELLIAGMRPLPTVPSLVRKLPEPKTTGAGAASSPAVAIDAAVPGNTCDMFHRHLPATPRQTPPTILPLAPERYKVQLTIDGATHDKLRKAQDLLRHVVPNGDVAAIFDRALTVLLQKLEQRKLAQVEKPRQSTSSQTRTRHVPAAVRREVWARDAGRCAFVGTHGRCEERGFLEFHHGIPYAEGGATTAANLQLRCRAHNAHEAREYFGGPLLRERPPAYAARSGPSRPKHCRTSVRDRMITAARTSKHSDQRRGP
jgi:5-methylcytosine-specific restriction endonuclease McrA